MESHGKNKKRQLPSWMITVGSQSKTSKTSCQTLVTGTINNTVERDDDNRFIKTPTEHQNNGRVLEEQTNISASNIIAQSMPFMTFSGSVIYSCHTSDCAILCEDISSSLKDECITPVGFDMEWPVSYKKGDSNKTALIQMCIDETCYLFHVAAMDVIPKSLGKLILDSRINLVGLNIEADLWKLYRDFDINPKSIFDRKTVIDIGKLANKKLKSLEHWSLEGLCRNILQQRLDKNSSIRCGSWSEYPLNKEQKLYAATDANAGLVVYLKLLSL